MAVNLRITAAEWETRGPLMESGVCLLTVRGFMDDLTITTQPFIQSKWVLSALEDVVSRARMKFKPRKSRSMVLK